MGFWSWLTGNEVKVMGIESSQTAEAKAASRVSERSREEKLRSAATARLKAGMAAGDRHARRIGQLGAAQLGAFDRNTEQGQASMRSEAARSLAATSGRGMRANVNASLDQGMRSGQAAADFFAERDSQRAQMAGAVEMQRGQADMAAADRGFEALQGIKTVGTADSEARQILGHAGSSIPVWRAEAEAAGLDPETYVQQKLSGMMAETNNPEALAGLSDLHSEQGS